MSFGPVTINRPGASATVGIMGPKGKKGTPGKDGVPGPQGPAVFLPIVAWVSGTTYSPGTATQAASYVSIGGSSYACTAVHTAGVFAADLAAGLWEPVALQGPLGQPGAPGSTWYTGTAAPANAVGINGDYFFRSDTGDVLLKVSSAWTTIGNIQGPSGPPADPTALNAAVASASASAALAARLTAGTNFIGASATSLAPALGTVALVLTASTAQGFAPSAFMAFVSASDWTCSMQGQFVSYDPKSGTLTLNVFALGPNTAATEADWTVVPTPPPYLPTAINGGSFTDPAPGTAVTPFTVAQSGTPTGVNGGTF